MKLIDGNNISNGIALYLAENAYLNDTAQGALEMVANWVIQAPAVDAVEVVHGRWVKTENGIRPNINTGEMVMAYMHDCSVCGWHTGNQGRNFNYCPNCGAKMDGGEDDG